MNGILIINKPQNLTSRAVINKLNHLLKTKKIGHTGTLDPLATGVLVVCIGSATKLCNLLTSHYKEYIATIKLGIKTDTLDITGNIIEEKDFNITEDEIKKVLNKFLGKSIQTTPIYSAVKVNGKKLYEYARSGEYITLPKREIDITSIELLSFKKDEIVFKTTVSKGTYIRALIDDICKSLNTVGTMSSLTRTKQGIYDINKSYSLEDIQNNNYHLITIEEVLSSYETIDIDDRLYKSISNGAIIDKIFTNDIAVFKYQDKVLAIYQVYHKDSTKAKPYIMF